MGPQVISHIFGLRKAFENGSAEMEGEPHIEGGKWLSTDEGSVWLIEQVDKIVGELSREGGGYGHEGAPPKAKL